MKDRDRHPLTLRQRIKSQSMPQKSSQVQSSKEIVLVDTIPSENSHRKSQQLARLVADLDMYRWQLRDWVKKGHNGYEPQTDERVQIGKLISSIKAIKLEIVRVTASPVPIAPAKPAPRPTDAADDLVPRRSTYGVGMFGMGPRTRFWNS